MAASYRGATLNLPDGPAAPADPARLTAVPVAREMPSVSLPEVAEIITVRQTVQVPLIPIMPLAVPVRFRVIAAGVRSTAAAPAYLIL